MSAYQLHETRNNSRYLVGLNCSSYVVCMPQTSTHQNISNFLNHTCMCFCFWDSVLLSLRVFGLLSSSLLLFSQRFGRYVRKSSFPGQYLNFNSHHRYTVKKGIVGRLKRRAKTIRSDTDAYQEEMVSLRHNLHRNNYPDRITSATRNLYRRTEDNIHKLTTVCLPYVKGLAERTQKICRRYDIRTVFTSGSTLWRYVFRVNGIQHDQELCLHHPLQLW